jgi:urease accessory protein
MLMTSITRFAWVGGLACLGFAPSALAHPGHGGVAGFTAGLYHPLCGIDHVLAMLAVGLCAAQVGGRARWLLPLTFLACMVAGGVVAIGGPQVPMVEQGIAASVLLLGLLVARGAGIGMPALASLIGLFAVFHGYAHGAEMQPGTAPAPYAAGFLTATAALIAAGLGVGLVAKRPAWRLLPRLAGGAIAACGLALMIWM